MKCLVINLDRSTDRLAYITRTFRGLDLRFERFPAVDGAQLPTQALDRVNASNRWIRPLARAEIGCLLSHRGCWETIAAGSAPYAAVFEDDVLISPGAALLLRSPEWVPHGVDFIKLETRNRSVTVSRLGRRVASGRRLVKLLSFHDGLGGYIISRGCAQRLCAQLREHSAPVDQLVLNPQFGIFGGLDVRQLTPAICITNAVARRINTRIDELPSTIDPDGALYRADDTQLQRSPDRNLQRRVSESIQRMTAGLRRAVRGHHRTIIEYR